MRRARIGKTPRWNTKAGADPEVLDSIRTRVTRRDWVVLTLVHQHGFLTTADVVDLLYPTHSGVRQAQKRLRWMAEVGLIHWPHASGDETRWERVPRPLWLTPRGAAQLAHHHHLDPTAAIHRAVRAHQRQAGVDHALAVVRFMVLIAMESAELPDSGLYHWIGDDSMRARTKAAGSAVTPDAWGRYLGPENEVVFNLEWDNNTENEPALTKKALSYLEYHDRIRSRTTVAFVAPSEFREERIRKAVEPATRGRVRFVTTTVDAVAGEGPLASIWTDAATDEHLPLADWGGPQPRGRLVENCLCKPLWWTRRPLGGEGDG